MKKQPAMLMLALMMAGLTSAAHAETAMTAKAQYAADNKKAAVRYAEDKKLCAEESASSARLQCLRDAKAEYSKALAAAKTVMTDASKTGNKNACIDCGKVIAVNVSEKQGESGPMGMIAGGVAGALLGHQVGQGHGKDLATIAGAAGGAYAGNKVEQKMKASKIWTVSVQYDNDRKNTFNFDQDPGLAAGDLVKNAGNSIVRR